MSRAISDCRSTCSNRRRGPAIWHSLRILQDSVSRQPPYAKEYEMLVLTRKTNQQIQIGDGVVITILQVKGNSVRVGIEAPRDIRVIRGELERRNDEAAHESAADPNAKSPQ